MLRHPLFANHSFRLMLYLEWILLGITLLGEIRPAPHRFGDPTLPFSILAIIAFGGLGLKLPKGPVVDKVLYTALEFGLLFLAFLLDSRPAFFPLLGLVIVIRSCLIFQQVGRLGVAGLVFTTFLLTIFHHGRTIRPPRWGPPPGHPSEAFASTILTLKINTAVTFGLTLLFILLLVNALLAERQSREKLMLAHEQLRQYALRIEDQATLQERNRIAREIHDALGHTLTAQSIQLENALLFLPAEAQKTASFLQEARQLGTRALQEVRRSISTLRANPLQGQSLEEAVRKAIAEFSQTSGITPDCAIQLPPSLPSEISTALYRIVQESLTNIYRHSNATQVRLSLKEHLGSLYLGIADNGQGFNPEGNTTGFGLQGMRERTAALGGRFSLTSQPGQGCRLSVLIPLPRLTL